ncbi:hypothetical protein [Absidia glauca]|uniref:Bromo domain-containing protein n=1 Tax=Absidia glauca TaxID=4829 RepID=A0A163IS24_ABSGL|nr:hypothetical protein [Absidia glauca]
MERRPKRQSSTNIDYKVRIRATREPKLKIVHRSVSPYTSQDNGDDTDGTTVKDQCLQLLDALNHLQDPDDGTYLNSLFLELPSKDLYADYYQVIKAPIALDIITNKATKNKYATLDDMKSDLHLMVENAKTYNLEESQVYQDAMEIQKLVKSWAHGSRKRRTSRSLSSSEKKSPAPSKNVLKLPGGAFTTHRNSNRSNDDDEARARTIRIKPGKNSSKPKSLKPLMTAIENEDTKGALDFLAHDPNVNPNQLVEVNLSDDTFTWSPLHAACYYGLTKVCEALLARGADVELNDTWYSATPLGWAAYGDNEDIARLLVLKHNAKKDAQNVHGQVPFDLVPEQEDPKWHGIFVNLNAAPSSKKEIATSQLHGQLQEQQQQQQQHQQQEQQQKKYPLIMQHHNPNKKRRGRPLKSEIESKRAAHRPIHKIDLSTFDVGSFLIEIFNSIRKNSDNTHRLYSELFEELPNREEYADYYKVITNPLSLSMIEDKMRTNSYETVQGWFDDLVKVFENAMEYNENGSRIHKDGKLLLRMLYRLKEKLLFDHGIPESQEPEVMALDLTNRRFDLTGLRTKRPTPRPSEPATFESPGTSFSSEVIHPSLQQQVMHPQLQHPPHYLHLHQQQPQQHLHSQHPIHIQPQHQQYQQPLHHQQIRPHDRFPKDQRQHIAPSPAPPFPMAPMQAGLPFMNHGTFNAQQHPPGFMPMPPPGMMMMNGNPVLQPQVSATTPPILQQAMMSSSPRPPPPPSLPSSPNTTSIPNGTPPHQAYFNLMAAQQYNHPPAILAKDMHPQALPNQPISQINADFMQLINKDSSQVRLLDSVMLASDDAAAFRMNLDGNKVGHSLVIPAHVASVRLTPKLPLAMDKERARVMIQVMHNANNLAPQQIQAAPPSWSTRLMYGMNVFKLIIMVNATTPTSPHPDYRTQTYHLFVNHVS